MAARAVGPLFAPHVCRVGYVRKHDAESLTLGKRQHGRPDRGYSFVTVGANCKLSRSEFLNVTRYARAVCRHRRRDRISLSQVTLITF